MEYQCSLGKGKERWSGEVRLLAKSGSGIEAEITGRGSYFHVIAGKHLYGNYICIPNHSIGSELSDFQDIFWNTERLSGLLGKADAITVAGGLRHLKDLSLYPEDNSNR